VLEHVRVVVEAQQQRTDGVFAALVPAEASHHAVGRAHMLDLQHCTLPGAVRSVGALRHDAVEPGAFECP
jgi:hypothetical protein